MKEIEILKWLNISIEPDDSNSKSKNTDEIYERFDEYTGYIEGDGGFLHNSNDGSGEGQGYGDMSGTGNGFGVEGENDGDNDYYDDSSGYEDSDYDENHEDQSYGSGIGDGMGNLDEGIGYGNGAKNCGSYGEYYYINGESGGFSIRNNFNDYDNHIGGGHGSGDGDGGGSKFASGLGLGSGNGFCNNDGIGYDGFDGSGVNDKYHCNNQSDYIGSGFGSSLGVGFGRGYGDGSGSGEGDGYGHALNYTANAGVGCGNGSGYINGSGGNIHEGKGTKDNDLLDKYRFIDLSINYGFGERNYRGSSFGSENGYGDGFGNGSGSGSYHCLNVSFGYGVRDSLNNYHHLDTGLGCGTGDGLGNYQGTDTGFGLGDGDENKNNLNNYYNEKRFIIGNKTDQKAGLNTFLGRRVYYIDNIPCHIYSIHNNVARVGVIDIMDMSIEERYIAKYKNYFYHADTIKNAIIGVQNKYLSTIDIDDRIEMFKEKFNDKNKKYPAEDFYEWHTILTGSCDYGKKKFIESHNIDLEKDKFTVSEFIELTKNEYGSNIIYLLQ